MISADPLEGQPSATPKAVPPCDCRVTINQARPTRVGPRAIDHHICGTYPDLLARVESSNDLRLQLEQIVTGTSWLMRALEAVRSVGLPDWYLAAGAIRNTVWDALHGLPSPGPLGDLDVIYFDQTDMADGAQEALCAALPAYRWEVTNQATVHSWQSAATGREIAPYASIAAAVASWPETATAVGVRLTLGGELEILAPFGLEDLFSMLVRRNGEASDPLAFDARWREKAWQLRWPRLRRAGAAG